MDGSQFSNFVVDSNLILPGKGSNKKDVFHAEIRPCCTCTDGCVSNDCECKKASLQLFCKSFKAWLKIDFIKFIKTVQPPICCKNFLGRFFIFFFFEKS